MEDKSCSRGKCFSRHKSNSPLRRTRQVDKPVSKPRQRSLDIVTPPAPGFYNPASNQRSGESMRRDFSSSKRRREETQGHSSRSNSLRESITRVDLTIVSFPAPDFNNPAITQRHSDSTSCKFCSAEGSEKQSSEDAKIHETISRVELSIVSFPAQDFYNPAIKRHSDSRSCKLCSPEGSEAQSSEDAKIQATNFKLPGVPCQFCGRQYGTASIGIHEKQCPAKGKQKIDPKGKSPLQSEKDLTIRKVAFESAVKGSPNGQYDLDAVNKEDEVDLATVESQYIGCKHCGRTFLPDRLKVHEKHCRGK